MAWLRTYTHKLPAIFRVFLYTLIIVLLFSVCIFLIVQRKLYSNSNDEPVWEPIILHNVKDWPALAVKTNLATTARVKSCTHWTCFNIYRCGHATNGRIGVYIYPPHKYVDVDGIPIIESISQEYYELLDTVLHSKYYVSNPEKACIFVPSIDTLNIGRLKSPNATSRLLHQLKYWNNGENHLLFTMVPSVLPYYDHPIQLDTGLALIAGSSFTTNSFRNNFDISIPMFSPVAHLAFTVHYNTGRKWLLISSQIKMDAFYLNTLQRLSHHRSLLIVDNCENDPRNANNYRTRCSTDGDERPLGYPALLQDGVFCLVVKGERIAQLVLLEAMAANCIPVIAIDNFIMPFSSVIDWRKAVIFVMESYLHTVMDVLVKLSKNRIVELQKNLRSLYEAYFSSMRKITLTTLDILQDRIYPQWTHVYDDWNMRADEKNTNPLFLPQMPSKLSGFSAVILTYDRIVTLFTLIRRLSTVPSLVKIIVVWNNQNKAPPKLSAFPPIQKPIKVIWTNANKLSNRFYPYKEIETEAILHIDDDIIMLTSDEIEFAYDVWREFPDRIVGFPPRTHVYDNTTHSWTYQSEWTNEISMVLTGAAFLHKYWSFYYTTQMPKDVKEWVDRQMNCEDIAMNFLVANVTGKAPIKVAPRKKFKCPECVNTEMLSADMRHMVERSKCVDRFAKAFNSMPLRSVEFRADPVLFKESFPEKLKCYNDIGSL